MAKTKRVLSTQYAAGFLLRLAKACLVYVLVEFDEGSFITKEQLGNLVVRLNAFIKYQNLEICAFQQSHLKRQISWVFGTFFENGCLHNVRLKREYVSLGGSVNKSRRPPKHALKLLVSVFELAALVADKVSLSLSSNRGGIEVNKEIITPFLRLQMGFILFTFIHYDNNGNGGVYRTALNQMGKNLNQYITVKKLKLVFFSTNHIISALAALVIPESEPTKNATIKQIRVVDEMRFVTGSPDFFWQGANKEPLFSYAGLRAKEISAILKPTPF